MRLPFFLYVLLISACVIFCEKNKSEQTNWCSQGFIALNALCYQTVSALAPCPFNITFPFMLKSEEFHNLIIKDIQFYPEIGFYLWTELGENYGTLFKEEQQSIGQFIYYDHNASKLLTTNDVTLRKACIYREAAEGTNIATFCTNFNEICKKSSSSHCHCRSELIGDHFCGSSCSNFEDDSCGDCNDRFNRYENASIFLEYHSNHTIQVTVSGFLKFIPHPALTLPPIYCFTNANHAKHDKTLRIDIASVQKFGEKRTFEFELIKNSYGSYWCEGLDFRMTPVRSNVITIDTTDRKSIQIIVTAGIVRKVPFTIHETIGQCLQKYLGDYYEVQFLNVQPYLNNFIHLTYRISTLINNGGEMISELSTITKFCNCTVADCPLIVENNLTWPETPIGVSTTPLELCMDAKSSMPITRTCLFDRINHWADVSGECDDDYVFSDLTEDLFTWSNSNLVELYEFLDRSREAFTLLDLDLIAKIIEKSDDPLANDTTALINLLIDNVSSKTMKQAQVSLNFTDRLLDRLDRSLISKRNFAANDSDTYQITSKYIYVQVSRISRSNVILGAEFLTISGSTNLEIKTITDIHREAKSENYVMRAYLHPKIIDEIITLTGHDPLLAITLINSPKLFNEGDGSATVHEMNGAALSFSVSGLNRITFTENFSVLIRSNRKFRLSNNCSYWNYGIDSKLNNLKGRWVEESIANNLGDNLYLCNFNHMTHFALIFNSNHFQFGFIVAIGCGVCVSGGVLILTIQCLIGQLWRKEKAALKILINYSLVLIPQNLIFFYSATVKSDQSPTICITLGSILHYFLISEFCWILVFTYLQYSSYSQNPIDTDRFLMKTSIFAWLVPAVPPILVFVIFPQAFERHEYCFITNIEFYAGVVFPIILLIVINSIILFLTYRKVANCNFPSLSKHNRFFRYHLSILVLVFAMLGCYWTTAILSGLTQSVFLEILFCIFACIEGAVILFYYTFCNAKISRFWVKLYTKVTHKVNK